MKRITTAVLFLTVRGGLAAMIISGLLLLSPATSAQSNEATPHCVQVGGTVMTNFIAMGTTLGTATGDLKGAISATVTPGPAGTFLLLHHWVTEAGDDIAFEPATAMATPIAGNIFGVTYDHINVTGGSGKFDGATGVLTAFGAADFGRGQTVFRYSGEICFKAPGKP
jgi:hypothetical protein